MRRLFTTALLIAISAGPMSAQSIKETPPAEVRVAVVNIAWVLDMSEKEQKTKKQLEAALAPFKAQENRHKADIEAWQKTIANPESATASRQQLESKIGMAIKHLATLKADTDREFGKIKEKNLVASWTDLQAAIKTFATENNIDLVLGYSDPLNKDLLDGFTNVNRKMHMMDNGGTVPLHLAPNADISQPIADLLNKRSGNKKGGKRLGTDRMAVINIGVVFNHYKKALKFKSSLENDLAPYKAKAKVLTDNIYEWKSAISNGNTTAEEADAYRNQIKFAKKQLEDLGTEVERNLEKKQEENLVILWKDVQAGIKAYAAEHGIEMVLGYGDPMDRRLLELFPNVNRKMQAMDKGTTVPLIHAPGVEIAEEVTNLLNRRLVGPDEKAPNASKKKPQLVHVSVVNIGTVFTKYEKAQAFKMELEKNLQPYKAKAALLTNDIKKWQTAIENKDFRAASKAEYEDKIVGNKRELEDMGAEISRLLGKEQEDRLVLLWKEVQMGNQAYADAHQIGLILGYGDPMDVKLLDRYPNVKRKMEAIDEGGLVPLFMAARADVSIRVVDMLNKRVQPAKKAPPIDFE